MTTHDLSPIEPAEAVAVSAHDPYASTMSDPAFEPSENVPDHNFSEPASVDDQNSNIGAAAPPDHPPPRHHNVVRVKPHLAITILVGERNIAPPPQGVFQHRIPLQNRTALIRHHETVVDLFKGLSIPTDGSMVMLVPGTSEPFDMMVCPYDDLRGGAVLSVVPNRPDQAGPSAQPSAALPLLPTPPVPYSAKLLRDTDSTRPDLLVRSAAEEAKAKADGYTVEIPAPQSKYAE